MLISVNALPVRATSSAGSPSAVNVPGELGIDGDEFFWDGGGGCGWIVDFDGGDILITGKVLTTGAIVGATVGAIVGATVGAIVGATVGTIDEIVIVDKTDDGFRI